MSASAATSHFVRFQASEERSDGRRPGFFQLLRELDEGGRLDQFQQTEREAIVADAYRLHDEPAAAAYADPRAVSWFRSDADQLLALAQRSVALLDAHGVGWEALMADDPGAVTHVDRQQVVAVPWDERSPESAATTPRGWLAVADPQAYARLVLSKKTPDIPATAVDCTWTQVTVAPRDLSVDEATAIRHDADPVHRQRRDDFVEALSTGVPLPPLVVRGPRARLVDGYARLRAARRLGVDAVSVLLSRP